MIEINCIQFEEQGSKPANPSSGYRKIYPKSDGWYSLKSDGTEEKFLMGAAVASVQTGKVTGLSQSSNGYYTEDVTITSVDTDKAVARITNVEPYLMTTAASGDFQVFGCELTSSTNLRIYYHYTPDVSRTQDSNCPLFWEVIEYA